eukprot:Nitzschia sp. Nitz4//scaffold7_size249615//14445//15377//NITZ4_001136-RA/size249615-processed-gene-0.126-mRNA-1//1//CDS//3329558319//9108//frame0
MARGAEAKLRRRNRRKEQQDATDHFFGEEGEEELEEDTTELPGPPGITGKAQDDDETDETGETPVVLPKKKKKKARSTEEGDVGAVPAALQKKSGGIKTMPLLFLILMTGTTLLPVLIYASDMVGGFLQRNHVMGQIGFRLGLGSVPRQRVMSFYEKHDPNKVNDVPDILSKYYGDYPKLIKRLERKYQDYGYFLGWEQDEAPLTLALEQLQETYQVWLTQYWNVYAPVPVKNAFRNIRYNLGTLQKKFLKLWKKILWPALEPFLGVPKGVEQQKKKDAQEAKKRRHQSSGTAGTRRRNTDYRDDVEDEY